MNKKKSFYIELLNQILKRFDFSRNDIKHLNLITPNKVLTSSQISLEPLLLQLPNLTWKKRTSYIPTEVASIFEIRNKY